MEANELLEQVLTETVQRVARQSANYEAEIANLNAQIIILKDQLDQVNKALADVGATINDSE